MPVNAYIILRESELKIPHYFRSLTGPYLFRAEAEKYAAVITSAASISCRLNTIAIERMLGEAVRFNDRWLVTSVWNIRPTPSGFEGEVIIDGKLYKVQRSEPDQPWLVVEQVAKATG
jgi:hypothetical protein